jgi:hypothetical protein
MARRLSLGSSSNPSRRWPEREGPVQDPRDEYRQSRVVDFLGNPCQRPRAVEKFAWASDELQQRRELLSHHALLATEEGPMAAASREEVTEIIGHQFGLLRYEFQVYRSLPEPLIVIFSERAARDVVFTRGRISDGPVELRFHAWDADRFTEGVIVPYQVKLSIEGLPHHAWYQDAVDKVRGDVAVIHHVEQATRRKEDLRFFGCWAFCQDPIAFLR